MDKTPDTWWPADERFVREHVAKPDKPTEWREPVITEADLMEWYRPD